jgi:hypothetical protein
MYQVQMQFIPGYNNIWVAQLNPEDPTFEFEIEADAIAKAEELQAADMSGRQYKSQAPVVVEETPIVEEVVEETPAEEAVVEEVAVEEIPAAEVVEEAPAEEVPTEEPIV